MKQIPVKDLYGRIIGWLEPTNRGITVRDFYLRILGFYDKARNVTTDFHGRILYQGDMSSALILQNKK